MMGTVYYALTLLVGRAENNCGKTEIIIPKGKALGKKKGLIP